MTATHSLHTPADFRSDTVTRPTPAMWEAMTAAPLGDDVLEDDPTVRLLEDRVAALLGFEAALFVPSGTMANLIAVSLHCCPGDELLCEENTHLWVYEQGGYAQLCGVVARTFAGQRGHFDVETLRKQWRKGNVHFPRTAALFVENTHNRGGGSIWDADTLAAVCDEAHQHGVTCHLDGARLMNAVVATGRPAAAWTRTFDSVSICFSKGLGAPVGSILAASHDWIAQARRRRKVLGGGMRQVGVLAAACLYALDHHVERLHDDHQHAQLLADAIRALEHIAPRRIWLRDNRVDTNIVFFQTAMPAAEFTENLAHRGVLMMPLDHNTTRAVTHLDISRNDTGRAIDALQSIITTTP